MPIFREADTAGLCHTKGRKKQKLDMQTNSETLTDLKLKPYDKIHSSRKVWRSSAPTGPIHCPEPFLRVMYSEKSEIRIELHLVVTMF